MCGVKLGGWSLFKFDFLHISIRTSDLPMQYKSVIYSLTNLVRQVREKFSSNLISSLHPLTDRILAVPPNIIDETSSGDTLATEGRSVTLNCDATGTPK